jgi:hypothetical protein
MTPSFVSTNLLVALHLSSNKALFKEEDYDEIENEMYSGMSGEDLSRGKRVRQTRDQRRRVRSRPPPAPETSAMETEQANSLVALASINPASVQETAAQTAQNAVPSEAK